VPPLIETLNDLEWTVRKAATASLGHFKRQKDEIIPPLLERLEDERVEVRRTAILSLARLGRGSEKVGNALDRLAGDPDPTIRMNVGIALAYMGEVGESSIPMLLEAVAGKDKDTAEIAVRLLARVGKRMPDKVLPGLTAILDKKKDPGVHNALEVLERIGPRAMPAVPKIAAQFQWGDAKRRLAVMRTLTEVDGKGDQTLQTLLKAVKDPKAAVRRRALLGLMRFRPRPEIVFEPFTAALKDRDPENRQLALNIIRGMGSRKSEAAPEIIKLTRDPVMRVRTSAISALGSFRPSTEEIRSALTAALQDGNARTRRAAITALRRIGVIQPGKVIPILEKARDLEKDPMVKKSIAGALESLARQTGKSRGRIQGDYTKTRHSRSHRKD